jgi:16S rRNA (uracil1498-N3)-methyltransferase
MHRFFLTNEPNAKGAIPPAGVIALPERIAHQVRNVLHLSVGEQLLLLDNSGDEFVCTIASNERKGVEVEIIERRLGKPEPRVQITLCQGLLKSARFEWILEKGTELGVSSFAPMLCRRSMAGLEDAGPAKLQRWQRILQEASEQCGRARIPDLCPIRPLPHLLNSLFADTLALIPWEEEQQQSLRDVLQQVSMTKADNQAMHVMLFIGPEGGLLPEEVQLAQRHGAHAITLGPRILRAETAAIVAIANIMYALA